MDEWAAMLRQALRLGIVPEVFWRLSVREWRMLTVAAGGVQCLSRTALDEMMERWPDAG